MVMGLRVKPAMTAEAGMGLSVFAMMVLCCLWNSDGVLRECWSYSTKYHPCGDEIAGQARNDGRGWHGNAGQVYAPNHETATILRILKIKNI